MTGAGDAGPGMELDGLFGPRHPGMYVVLKRNLFYRPKAIGYTGILAHAGIYTPEEARYHEDRISGVSVMRWEDAPEFTAACFDDLARKHLQQQRDVARDAARRLAAELAAALAEAGAARGEALEEAAALVAPAGPRPCDCEHCDCGNPGDHAHVVAWDEANSNADAVRALKTRTPGGSHDD